MIPRLPLHSLFLLTSASAAFAAAPATSSALRFEKRVLQTGFYAEGITAADFNRDGHLDVASGPFWFEGPAFTVRHEIYTPVVFDPLKYSESFVAATPDLNGDSWPDLLVFGFPGKDVSWFENPGKSGGAWKRHEIFPTAGNESPAYADLSGDGVPDVVCLSEGRYGWAAPADPREAHKPWVFHPVTPPSALGRFTHGMGVGDLDGDGKAELLERGGWWERPREAQPGAEWTKRSFVFSPGRGGAQMQVVDINGDGRNDVVTSHDAHGHGLSWFERLADGGWREHRILSAQADERIAGLQFSQLHAVEVADMDGDGLLDIVTGKRWWAHGPDKDPDAGGAPVVYVFRQTRDADGKTAFEPILVDADSGVGTQIELKDLNGDGRLDILSANKRGIFVFLSVR